MRVIYDTNILLQILRKADSIERLQTQIGYQYLEECISIVTVAEIRSLANQFNWGSIRINKMTEILADLPTLDINLPEIIDKYVEMDCYSKRKHPILISDFSAIKMGKNDLWIAATADVYNCTLLTTDLDFQHLQGRLLNFIYIDGLTFIN